ncbi:MAG TPA: SDR family NAD(P)-dependent oxidoreductase [Bacteroidetes bacterium]|nr:SDR family NAD(P)-dependent oxidoreductase [Candidatus Limimorpha avicola]
MEKTKVIITGATGAIGSAVADSLASRHCDLVLACRNINKGELLRSSLLSRYDDIDIRVMYLDLSSLKSVADFVRMMEKETVKPDAVLNNAGVMCRDFSLTEDGLETTVGVNYVATFLLTCLLIPHMSEDFNIVNTVSLTRYMADVDESLFDFNPDKYGQLHDYANSKYALLLFTLKLSKMLNHGHVNMTDPGVVNSDMIRMNRWFDPLADVLFRPLCKKPEKAAVPACNALFSKRNGLLYHGDKFSALSDKYHKHHFIDKLWDMTVQLLAEKGFTLNML